MLPLLEADDFGGLLTEGSLGSRREEWTILTTSALIDQFVAGSETDGNARRFRRDRWTPARLPPAMTPILGARIAKQNE
jgi:hypothetical protein